jgi:hypothetical protein
MTKQKTKLIKCAFSGESVWEDCPLVYDYEPTSVAQVVRVSSEAGFDVRRIDSVLLGARLICVWTERQIRQQEEGNDSAQCSQGPTAYSF